MAYSLDVQRSTSQIVKAMARLAYQRAAVGRLGFNADVRVATIASETVARMERRLGFLRAKHAILMEKKEA